MTWNWGLPPPPDCPLKELPFEKKGVKSMIIDYTPAKECKNEEVWYTCYKCGACGRKFNEYGFMIDDGGTHPQNEEEGE